MRHPSAGAAETLELLGARLVTVVPENQRRYTEGQVSDDVVVIGDHTGALKQWFDTKPVGVVLLRPDHFIAGACLAQDTSRMVAAVGQTDQPEMFNQLFTEFFRDGFLSRATATWAGISTRRPELPGIVQGAS